VATHRFNNSAAINPGSEAWPQGNDKVSLVYVSVDVAFGHASVDEDRYSVFGIR
jgi:hypothetical protein